MFYVHRFRRHRTSPKPKNRAFVCWVGECSPLPLPRGNTATVGWALVETSARIRGGSVLRRNSVFIARRGRKQRYDYGRVSASVSLRQTHDLRLRAVSCLCSSVLHRLTVVTAATSAASAPYRRGRAHRPRVSLLGLSENKNDPLRGLPSFVFVLRQTSIYRL